MVAYRFLMLLLSYTMAVAAAHSGRSSFRSSATRENPTNHTFRCGVYFNDMGVLFPAQAGRQHVGNKQSIGKQMAECSHNHMHGSQDKVLWPSSVTEVCFVSAGLPVPAMALECRSSHLPCVCTIIVCRINLLGERSDYAPLASRVDIVQYRASRS